MHTLGRFGVRSLLQPGLQGGVVAGLLLALYGGILARQAADWWNYPEYSHGLLIPPVALYIAWMRRDVTLAIPAAPSGYGVFLTAAACLVLLIGRLGAEFFLTRISFVILLAGLAWTFWGLERLRTLAFPLVLLATMVPLPAIVYNLLAAPLQLFASSVATHVVRAVGIPVYQEGNVIHLSRMSLGVAEACSGLRSLSSLTVMALLVGFVQLAFPWARAVLFALALPTAILANVLRIAVTALLVEHDPQWALGFYHSFSGWMLFLAGLGLLVLWAQVLHRMSARLQPSRDRRGAVA